VLDFATVSKVTRVFGAFNYDSKASGSVFHSFGISSPEKLFTA
jgi:hypothetical protein